ncbi:MAG: hypothetical protein A2751_05705 [Candidatus Doudnabacteria bacterium RIFCSPHIGHO2_01_FULL_46_14]|uniref:Uncharacterized protein n=1 Tax=Candidatus Doudnabacteria bacterium RIFCSPHIGHO2_01_FULL_46_14 TaxID=1817824 RepID=A0A1F5NNA3_9BACT|nr:MAG: hypothetical protein A2751_05705 [Candidatus Doudnabacteria bacterium RIFCSPHIGHO2_01_FULL_46_14]
MINIPKLPEKEDFQFKEKAFLMDLYQQFQSTSKIWYYVLIAVIILSIPAGIILRKQLARSFIANLPIIPVSSNPVHPQDLKIAGRDFFPVGTSDFFSVYARVFNPNADLSARSFDYEFVFKNKNGVVLNTVSGSSFLLRGASKFIVVPAVALAETPIEALFTIKDVKWTRAVTDFKPQFDILQKQSGDSDGKFFVEALVKNSNSFSVKRVTVPVVVFASDNKTVLAVNQTVLDDLQPFESRYSKVFWPVPRSELFPSAVGQIEVMADVNPLDPGWR